MASLSDQIDRLTHSTKAIQSTTTRTGNTSGNNQFHSITGLFTRAVLNTHLGDLIRDIDPSELGLFSLLSPPANALHDRDTRGAPGPEITRVEFPGATPLRKPTSRREETHKPKELQPEVYAQAALKYIDRYQPMRPMPRAHSQAVVVIEQLNAIRENIQTLQETLQQSESVAAPPPKSLADDEERRVQFLQDRVLELKQRKAAAIDQQKGSRRKNPQSRPATSPKNPKLATPIASTSDVREEMFWTTPAAAARTLRFTDKMLMDEHVDLGDVSTTSFTSPMSRSMEDDVMEAPSYDLGNSTPEDHDHATSDDNISSHDDSSLGGGDEDEGEKTVMLQRHLPSPLKLTDPVVPIPSQGTPVERPRPPSLGPQSNSADTLGVKETRVKVTSQVERIVAKIWSTAGEIIMPGHHFDLSGSGTGTRKLPRAKETIAHLQSLSAQTPSPTSPTTPSISSSSGNPSNQPTSHEILTAHLLLLLLSSPHFSMPLNKVKEALASKAGAKGNMAGALGQGTTRALYGCVAKRLVKIERGGGEQVVKFDI